MTPVRTSGIGALLVDGANIAYSLSKVSASHLPMRIDYDRLVKLLQLRTGVKIAYKCYYATHIDAESRSRRLSFQKLLAKWGFTTFEFQTRQCADGRYRDKMVDIEIALDAYQLGASGSITHLFLMTHDSDFAAVFRRLPKIKRFAVGWCNFMARELRECTEPFYLDDAIHEIEYV